MEVMMLAPIECPRCNQATKEVDVNPQTHVRTCPTCGYTWAWREGMATYPGEFDVPAAGPAASDTVPGVEVAAAGESAGETAATGLGGAETSEGEKEETHTRHRRRG
jgi:hypothetical protein